jgi:hypothetical protein
MKGNEGHWGEGISIITQNFPKSPSILFHPLESSISQTSPQRLETSAHLFLRCNFAKACWASLGITVITTRPILQIINHIKRDLRVPFFMEIIILMSWSVWKSRNDWIFNNIDPSVEDCQLRFISDFKLLLQRAKHSSLLPMENWLNSV